MSTHNWLSMLMYDWKELGRMGGIRNNSSSGGCCSHTCDPNEDDSIILQLRNAHSTHLIIRHGAVRQILQMYGTVADRYSEVQMMVTAAISSVECTPNSPHLKPFSSCTSPSAALLLHDNPMCAALRYW
jgi:hypothetical protein